MKVSCLGGGPAGLYLGISLKLRNPDHEIEVYERNKPDDTFGWGIVFSDQTVDNISANDPVSAQRIVNEFIHWDLIDCHVSGEVERSGGHGFIGLGRKRFLQLLHERAAELGVALHFEQEIGLDDIDTRFADVQPCPNHALAAPLKSSPRACRSLHMGRSAVGAFKFAHAGENHGGETACETKSGKSAWYSFTQASI